MEGSLRFSEQWGAPAVEYLVINLRDSDKRVRMAAGCFGLAGDHRAYDHRKMLDDPDRDVRFASVIALAAFCDTRAVEPLSRACHDPHCYVRTIAAMILEKFRLQIP